MPAWPEIADNRFQRSTLRQRESQPTHLVAAGTAEVGNGIQNVSEAIGVGVIGASVNSLVSGIGEGVGNTVEGGKHICV